MTRKQAKQKIEEINRIKIIFKFLEEIIINLIVNLIILYNIL